MLFYVGIAEANRAWLAWRAGNIQQTVEKGRAALADWAQVSTTIQFRWPALFPLLAAALAQGNIAEAIDHARGMLPPPQMRLPQTLEAILQSALIAWEANHSEDASACLRQAIQHGAQLGYL
jgi:hypothetical protein